MYKINWCVYTEILIIISDYGGGGGIGIYKELRVYYVRAREKNGRHRRKAYKKKNKKKYVIRVPPTRLFVYTTRIISIYVSMYMYYITYIVLCA